MNTDNKIIEMTDAGFDVRITYNSGGEKSIQAVRHEIKGLRDLKILGVTSYRHIDNISFGGMVDELYSKFIKGEN